MDSRIGRLPREHEHGRLLAKEASLSNPLSFWYWYTSPQCEQFGVSLNARSHQVDQVLFACFWVCSAAHQPHPALHEPPRCPALLGQGPHLAPRGQCLSLSLIPAWLALLWAPPHLDYNLPQAIPWLLLLFAPGFLHCGVQGAMRSEDSGRNH